MDKEKIIAFLEGRLAPVEQEAIAHKIATDAEFAAAVDNLKTDWTIQVMAGTAFLKDKMKEWETIDKEEKPFFKSKKNWETALSKEVAFLKDLETIDKAESITEAIPKAKVIPLWHRYRKSFGIAASLLFLLTIGTYQWSHTNLSNNALLSNYYEEDLALNRAMGPSEATVLLNMEKAIQQQQYDKAIQQGENLLSTEINGTIQVKVNYLIAQAYQRQKDYPNAIRYFEIVENTAAGTAKKKAQINSILLYVVSGNKEQGLTKLRLIKEKDNLGTEDLALLNDLEKKLNHPLRSFFEKN